MVYSTELLQMVNTTELLQIARLWSTNRIAYDEAFWICLNFFSFTLTRFSRFMFHSLMIFGENKHFAIFHICRVVNEWKSVSSTTSVHNSNDLRNKRLALILQWMQTIGRCIQSLFLKDWYSTRLQRFYIFNVVASTTTWIATKQSAAL